MILLNIIKKPKAAEPKRARFKTEIKQVTPNELGQDSVAFTISTNSGNKFGSLIKIASGGELSRFLLALKVCLTNGQSEVSMVFDEIDRGIGGATVRRGRKEEGGKGGLSLASNACSIDVR